MHWFHPDIKHREVQGTILRGNSMFYMVLVEATHPLMVKSLLKWISYIRFKSMIKWAGEHVLYYVIHDEW